MSELKITSVRIYNKPPNEKSNIVATASVILNHVFLINGIKIIKTKTKMFCGMPSIQQKNFTFKDICNPLNQETRSLFENKIIAEYIAQEAKK